MRLFAFTACLLLVNTLAAQEKITECVIENGLLKTVTVDYNMSTGERTIMVNGTMKKFYDVYPKEGKEYAAKTAWFTKGDPVAYKGSTFIIYGLPRILGIMEIERTGEFKGVGVYTEAGVPADQVEVIYIPVRAGCEFQPYQKRQAPCATVALAADKKQPKQGDQITFTSVATGATGTIEYKWYLEGGTIVGDDNGKTLKVSTAGFSGELFVQLSVQVPGKPCEMVYQHMTLQVKK